MGRGCSSNAAGEIRAEFKCRKRSMVLFGGMGMYSVTTHEAGTIFIGS